MLEKLTHPPVENFWLRHCLVTHILRVAIGVGNNAMLYKPNSPNYEGIRPPCHPVYCVAQCRSIFLSAKVSQMSGQFGTGAEVSWVRSVLGLKCLDTAA